MKAARVLAAVLVIAVTAACDPTYEYLARNDSARDVVIVVLGSQFQLNAGDGGRMISGIGQVDWASAESTR